MSERTTYNDYIREVCVCGGGELWPSESWPHDALPPSAADPVQCVRGVRGRAQPPVARLPGQPVVSADAARHRGQQQGGPPLDPAISAPVERQGYYDYKITWFANPMYLLINGG